MGEDCWITWLDDKQLRCDSCYRIRPAHRMVVQPDYDRVRITCCRRNCLAVKARAENLARVRAARHAVASRVALLQGGWR